MTTRRAPILPYIRLVRAPAVFTAVFTAVSNILAAHLIATGGAIDWPVLGLVAAASACLYSAGMVLNDCFDLAEDRRDRPARPLPSGAVPLAAAWAIGWGLLALTGAWVAILVALGWLGSTWALLPIALALAAGLHRLRGAYRDFTPETIQGALRLLILGIVPLDALLALAGGPWWGALAAFALLLPTRWLGRTTDVT